MRIIAHTQIVCIQPEIKHHAPNKGFLLLGLKGDLECEIDQQRIEEVKNEIGADAYIQASALENTNIDHVFETAMRNFFKPRAQKKRKGCTLL